MTTAFQFKNTNLMQEENGWLVRVPFAERAIALIFFDIQNKRINLEMIERGEITEHEKFHW